MLVAKQTSDSNVVEVCEYSIRKCLYDYDFSKSFTVNLLSYLNGAYKLPVQNRYLLHSRHRFTTLCVSSDNEFLATGGEDTIIRLWKLSDFKGKKERTPVVRCLSGHSDTINYLQFSGDSRYVISGSYDKSVRVWDVNGSKGDENVLVLEHEKWFWVPTFSLDSELVVTMSDSVLYSLDLISIKKRSVLHTLKGHTGNILCVTFSKLCPHLLATGSADENIKLWDLKDNRNNCSLKCQGKVYALAFANKNKSIIAAGTTDKVLIWSIETGQLLVTINKVFNSYVNFLKFSPDDSSLVSKTDKDIILWKTSNYSKCELSLKNGVVSSFCNYNINFSEDSKIVSIATSDKSLKVFSIPEKEECLKINTYNNVSAVNFFKEKSSFRSIHKKMNDIDDILRSDNILFTLYCILSIGIFYSLLCTFYCLYFH